MRRAKGALGSKLSLLLKGKLSYSLGLCFPIALLVFSSFLFGQSQKTKEQERKEEKTAQKILDIKDYKPLSKKDIRFVVSKPTFSRHLAVDGSGEYLDVIFDIQNHTTESINFYLFVSAYNESDLVDKKYRKWVPHTKWRKRDFYKEDFIVNKVSITPKDILPSLIWDANDPDQAHYRALSTLKKNFVSTTRPLPEVYPPMWKYLEYIRHNPKTGVAFQLSGALVPPADKAIQTGKARALLYEKEGKARMSKKDKPKYTIENSPHLSMIYTYHFSDFGRDRNFFNRVAIQLFDAEDVDKNLRAGGAGEAAFKKIYSIKVP